MVNLQIIQEPWDEHELAIIRQLEEIKFRYMREAEPLQKILADSRACKIPKYLIMPDIEANHDPR